MAREYFKNLPDKTTPLSANRINGLLNGEESIEKIVVGKIESKNIFNGHMELGQINSATGANENSSDRMRSVTYLKVKPNTTYSITSDSSIGRIVEYTSAKSFIKCYYNTNTITTSSTTEYIRFSFNATMCPSNIQVEEGQPTNYVPHINFSNEQIYSTQEQIIGKWMDGKPLYRKTISFGKLPNATQTNILHNIQNLDKIIDWKCVSMTNSTIGKYTMMINSTSTSDDINILLDAKRIYIRTSTNMTEYSETYVTIEYTKTTD